ncbi:general odorant-binding protein 19d-like [Contarinia nasturtii]|uniref:general odorant-binding protein 19d-like n=1 Tax=Contarinia nasturtii TaxID=265458 RepID=UPI0012D39A7A|nr:general odorant-binding protein 19d-like [Contarinia nasturtii]
MKSFFSVLFIIGITFIVGLEALKPEESAAEKKLLNECKNLAEATDDDVNLLLERKVPEDYKGKCLLKCAYEKSGVILEGTFSIEKVKAFGTKLLEDNTKALGIFNEMIVECQTVADPDICEQSAKFMDCMIKAGLERGIDPKKGIKESIGSI